MSLGSSPHPLHPDTTSADPVRTLIAEAVAALRQACQDQPDAEGQLDLHDWGNPGNDSDHRIIPTLPAHQDLLLSAISSIPEDSFPALKSGLMNAWHHLHWRVDDGGYYAKGADVGEGYKTGNMHALLIGPDASPIVAEDYLLGLFLLAPFTLYRDHRHRAPELYLPLTGPSGWRFDHGDWRDADAGTLIYNAPSVVHATRVYEVPFLSLFAWTGDTASRCEVVHSDDWTDIETTLAARHHRN